MEDTFRSRVDKVFGSLPGAAPTAATTPSSSLWSLTDDEVEAVRWRKSADDDDDDDDDDMESLSAGLVVGEKPKATPSTGFLDPIENDLDDLDDDEEEKKKCGGSSDAPLEPKPDDYNDEEWEIKNSIGRDCTLDFEDEEDQYDKVAVGRVKSGDRVYMKDLTKNQYDIDTGSSSSLKKGFLKKDPRANHMAAKLRLKEDDEAAANKIDSLKVSGNGGSQQDSSLKSILKRKGDQLEAQKKKQLDDSKSSKRVRFDPECIDGSEDPSDDIEMEGGDDSLVYPMPESYPSGIPDYMRNPTKYTKYTFPATDVDEGSNRQAYMDFLKLTKKSEPEENDLGGELPKSLQFVPRKKDNCNEDSKNKQENVSHRKGVIAAAADADLEAGETSNMDEDVPETEAGTQNGSSAKPGRQYRMKAKA